MRKKTNPQPKSTRHKQHTNIKNKTHDQDDQDDIFSRMSKGGTSMSISHLRGSVGRTYDQACCLGAERLTHNSDNSTNALIQKTLDGVVNSSHLQKDGESYIPSLLSLGVSVSSFTLSSPPSFLTSSSSPILSTSTATATEYPVTMTLSCKETDTPLSPTDSAPSDPSHAFSTSSLHIHQEPDNKIPSSDLTIASCDSPLSVKSGMVVHTHHANEVSVESPLSNTTSPIFSYSGASDNGNNITVDSNEFMTTTTYSSSSTRLNAAASRLRHRDVDSFEDKVRRTRLQCRAPSTASAPSAYQNDETLVDHDAREENEQAPDNNCTRKFVVAPILPIKSISLPSSKKKIPNQTSAKKKSKKDISNSNSGNVKKIKIVHKCVHDKAKGLCVECHVSGASTSASICHHLKRRSQVS